ncbi:hypothetical protein H2509_06670 [Stappia sp. F7233]|uniref:Uncharacterized protein n=1 Tax=Stappia albiluteola TaxID=2758565 RepID=A0A839AAW7_9HYPH|nr:hypothetical protein [Stappia albiluteola]MBA5776810.1 hypothetical protein [Stappia albiluteola]
MLTAIGRWGLILAAGCAALLLAVFDVDRHADSSAASKGDRLVPLVKVACEEVTMVDTSKGCTHLGSAGSASPKPGAYITQARTVDTTTVLIRKMITE